MSAASPERLRRRHGVAALLARDWPPREIAIALNLPRALVEEIIDELQPAPEPEPQAPAEPLTPLQIHYRFWAAVSRGKAVWLLSHGLREEHWAATRQAVQFERKAQESAA